MELSKRLLAVASLVSQGNRVCDAGCDHGYVSIWLVRQKISPRAIAMDVRKGPLARAREHVLAYGLDKYIETRLSDGVSALEKNEADTLILAGMGGRLCVRILSQGGSKIQAMQEIVLQPQSEIWRVRRFLREQGYEIRDEDMVFEDGKFYPVLRAVFLQQKSHETTGMTLQREAYDKYGEHLLKKRHPVLKQFLLWEDGLESRIMRELEEQEAQRRCDRQWQTGADRLFQRRKQLEENRRIRNFAMGFWQCEEADNDLQRSN